MSSWKRPDPQLVIIFVSAVVLLIVVPVYVAVTNR